MWFASKCKRKDCRRKASGFTLVEMAVVLVIVGLIVMTVFPALDAMRTASQAALTQGNMRNVMLATAAYVQANGCLPCPADTTVYGTRFGSLGYASPATACGTCSNPEGIVPFASLGLAPAVVHDGWGHWITMRVDPALTKLPGNSATCAAANTCSSFVPPWASCTPVDVANGFCLSTASGAAKGLCAASLSASASANPVLVTQPAGGTQKAAVIFISHGKFGYGSYLAQAKADVDNGTRLPFPSNYAACTSYGGFAQCNASGTASFVDAPRVDGDTDPYDDVLAYADRNSLIALLGNPVCNTVW